MPITKRRRSQHGAKIFAQDQLTMTVSAGDVNTTLRICSKGFYAVLPTENQILGLTVKISFWILKEIPMLGLKRIEGKDLKKKQTRVSLHKKKKGVRKGVLGGAVMITIAIVWFVAGYQAGYIFFYPPILFLIGLYAIIKGLITGNIAGKKSR